MFPPQLYVTCQSRENPDIVTTAEGVETEEQLRSLSAPQDARKLKDICLAGRALSSNLTLTTRSTGRPRKWSRRLLHEISC